MLFYPFKTVYYYSKLSKLGALERLVEQVQTEQESLEHLFEQVIKKPFTGKIEWGRFFLYVNGVWRPKKRDGSPSIEGQFYERNGQALIRVDYKPTNGLKILAIIISLVIFMVSFLLEWWFSSREMELGETCYVVLFLFSIVILLAVFHFTSKSAHEQFIQIFEADVMPREVVFNSSNKKGSY